jgi:hypothetical protein
VQGNCILWGLPGKKNIPNPLCQPIRDSVNQANSALDAAGEAVAAGQAALKTIETNKTDLNKRLADTTQKLQTGALQASYNAAKASLDAESNVLNKVQKDVTHYHAAYTRARNYMCVWKSGARCQA